MALDEARTESDTAADHVTDHNTLHATHNWLDGTWLHRLFQREGTAHVDDQEFNSALADNTALTVTGTAVWTVDNGVLSVLYDQQSAEDMAAQIWALTPSAAPVTMEVCVRLLGVRQGYNMVAAGFCDGTVAGSTRSSASLYRDNGDSLLISATNGTFTSHAAATWDETNSQIGSHLYLRYIWTAVNTFKALVSTDGVSWTDFDNTAATVSYTPTHFFVMASTWGGIQPSLATFEYIRITESDLSA